MQNCLQYLAYFNMECMLWMVLLHLAAASFAISCSQEDVSISLEQLVTGVTVEKSPIVIHDVSSDYTTLVLHVMDYSIPFSMFEYKAFLSFIKHHMKSLLENGTLTEFSRHLNFLLICGQECIENLMREVSAMDKTIGQGSLMRHFSTWLIISHDPLPHLNITLDNVALIQLPQVCSWAEANLPNQIMENPQRYSEFLKANHKIYESVSSLMIRVYTLLWTPGSREWSCVQPRGVSHDEQYNIIFPNTKRGLNGRQLRLSTLEWTIWAFRSSSNGEVTYTGAGIDAVDILARMLNFSYVIVEPVDMRWGKILENGSCTGVLRMLQRAEADMCTTPYIVSQRRSKIIDITSPFIQNEYKLLFRRQHFTQIRGENLLPWFSWQVYLCGFASLLWIVVIFAGITNRERIKMISSRKRNMSSCFEVGLHIPLRQDVSIFPESAAEMIIIWTLCIFCLVVTAVYAGNLVAFATIDKYNPPFTTLQELAEQDEYAIGVAEGGYAESILMNSDNPTLKLIYQKVTKSCNPWNNQIADNILRLLNEKYVLISVTARSNIIRSYTCEVVEMKERFTAGLSGYAFPRNSPLKKLFEKQVMLLAEGGVFDKIREKWTPKPLDCDDYIQAPHVKLTSMKTVLVICAAGILLAAVVLLVEIWKKKYCQ